MLIRLSSLTASHSQPQGEMLEVLIRLKTLATLLTLPATLLAPLANCPSLRLYQNECEPSTYLKVNIFPYRPLRATSKPFGSLFTNSPSIHLLQTSLQTVRTLSITLCLYKTSLLLYILTFFLAATLPQGTNTAS